MTDMPSVQSRDIHALMRSAVDAHHRIRQSIHDKANERARLMESRDAENNVNAKLGHKPVRGST